MNILRSNDVKRINKIVIRKALLELRSATRKELMEATGISSSSIGSLIMEMVRDHDILEESVDSSSGGRCPMRYVLNYRKHRVMCILMDREEAELHVLDCLYQDVYQETIPLADASTLQEKIIEYSERYKVKSIHVSTPGIIQGEHVIQDSPQGLIDLDFFANLKEALQLPLVIENDVNCMVQGYVADRKEKDETISYLYLSKEGGVGSASVNEGTLLRGNDHLAGEIGLLEYQGISVNNLLREHPSQKKILEILTQLITVLVCAINPSLIVLSGMDTIDLEQLIVDVEQIVSDRFTLQFVIDEENSYHILRALWSNAMELLMHENG